MNQFILVSFLTIVGSLFLQSTPTLDLTHPVVLDGAGRVSAITETAAIDVAVTITDLPDQPYTVGDEFGYTIKLTNTSSNTILIPWTGDPSSSEAVPDDQVIAASVNLTISNGFGSERSLTGVSAYGLSGIPATLLALAPGMSAQVKASGRWSVPGVRIRDYLNSSNGRVSIRAEYLLQLGTTMYSATPSPYRELTLRMPVQ